MTKSKSKAKAPVATPTLAIDFSNFVAPTSVEEAQAIFANIPNHQEYVHDLALGSVRNLNNSQQDMHTSLMVVALHFYAFNDCATFTIIYSGVKESDKLAIKQWCEEFTSAELRDTKNGKSFRIKEGSEFNLEAGNTNPYFTDSAEKQVAKQYSGDKMSKAIESIVKRATKAIEDDNLEEGSNIAKMLVQIEGLKETLTLMPANTDTDMIVDDLIENEGKAVEEIAA